MEWTLGLKIKALREKLDLSQKELAKKADTSASTISKIEGGNENPSYQLIQKIAGGLKIPISELVDMGVDPNKAKNDFVNALSYLSEHASKDELNIAFKILNQRLHLS